MDAVAVVIDATKRKNVLHAITTAQTINVLKIMTYAISVVDTRVNKFLNQSIME